MRSPHLRGHGTGPSRREHMLAFVGDTLAAVKYKQFKLHLVEYGEKPGHRYEQRLAMPQLYNVAADPKEEWDLLATNLWLTEEVSKVIAAFARSVQQFPNVPPAGDGPEEKTDVDNLMPRG
jgi:arylsulfatase